MNRINSIRQVIEKYMIIFLPVLFSIGKFVPFVETLVTMFIIVVLFLYQAFLKKNVIKYIIIFWLFIISGMMTSDLSMHLDHVKPMIIFFLAMDATGTEIYLNAIRHLEKYCDLVTVELIIVLGANVVFMFLDAGYSNEYGESWSLNAFEGIYSDPHQCAYHICALLVLLLWTAHFNLKKYHYLILLGYEYCALITGARAPTLIALILGGLFCVDHFIKPKTWKDTAHLLARYVAITIVMSVISYLVILRTSFGMKMLGSIANENFDNGRGTLRTRDIDLFMNSDWLHRLFGNGTYELISYHGSFAYSPAIWSHNDFMQILCGMGLILFGVYCLYWGIRLKKAKNESVQSLIVTMLFVIVAFINGLYIHTRLTFVMPLLFMYMNERASNKC